MKRFLLLALIGLSVSIPAIVWFQREGEVMPTEGVEVVARNLEVPWSLSFAPDGRLYFTERSEKVGVVVNKEIKTILRLNVVSEAGDEGGLLGLGLDPNFGQTHFAYVYYTYIDRSGQHWNRVSRFTETDDQLLNETVLIDQIPAYRIHNGGRIGFGPDGRLYVATGDVGQGELAQNLSSLAGRILRINPNGSIPSNNPFPYSPVYSYGHRNPQGLAWHPLTGVLYATEHGPSGERGFFAHDEVNLIEAGRNYGWPLVVGRGNDARFADPIYETGQATWAPSGAVFYNGSLYPQMTLRLLVATLRGQHLRMVSLSPPEYANVESTVALYQGEFGRLRDIAQGPDGFLYFATSNRDGRGQPGSDDDRILRIGSVSRGSASIWLLMRHNGLSLSMLRLSTRWSRSSTKPQTRSRIQNQPAKDDETGQSSTS